MDQWDGSGLSGRGGSERVERTTRFCSRAIALLRNSVKTMVMAMVVVVMLVVVVVVVVIVTASVTVRKGEWQ